VVDTAAGIPSEITGGSRTSGVSVGGKGVAVAVGTGVSVGNGVTVGGTGVSDGSGVAVGGTGVAVGKGVSVGSGVADGGANAPTNPAGPQPLRTTTPQSNSTPTRQRRRRETMIISSSAPGRGTCGSIGARPVGIRGSYKSVLHTGRIAGCLSIIPDASPESNYLEHKFYYSYVN
jgi:hypothetical protein